MIHAGQLTAGTWTYQLEKGEKSTQTTIFFGIPAVSCRGLKHYVFQLFFFEDDHGFGDSSYPTLPSRVEWILHTESSSLLKKHRHPVDGFFAPRENSPCWTQSHTELWLEDDDRFLRLSMNQGEFLRWTSRSFFRKKYTWIFQYYVVNGCFWFP